MLYFRQQGWGGWPASPSQLSLGYFWGHFTPWLLSSSFTASSLCTPSPPPTLPGAENEHPTGHRGLGHGEAGGSP